MKGKLEGKPLIANSQSKIVVVVNAAAAVAVYRRVG